MKLREKANDAYYHKSKKIITDTEFDLLSDNGLGIINFRKKTNHFQPMGSLKKIKTEDEFNKWIKGSYTITPKLDGNSIELVYEDGKLVKGITRGDGFVGNDITDKVKHCNVLHTPVTTNKYSLKCEAIMKKIHQKHYDKNIRNVVAGVLNRKIVQKDQLKMIDIVPFVEMNYIERDDTFQYEFLEEWFNDQKDHYEYEIDGLVISLTHYHHEETDELLPSNTVSLKFNKDGIDGIIGDIEWNLGKHSRLTPVLILKESIEIDGTMVQRVSASNWSLLVEAGLGIGAKVQVIKSGDIIPFISKVKEKSDDIIFPQCPVCSTTGEMNETEVNMICPNFNCKGKELIKLQHIFKTFDLEYISDITIENLYNSGINSIEKYFNLTVEDICIIPGFGKSKANNIINKLKSVSINEAQVLKCAMIQGISESNGQRLVDHFGNIDKFLKEWNTESYLKIDGIGPILSETVSNNINNFAKMYDILNGHIMIQREKVKVKTGTKIVFTGKCKLYKRTELTKVLEDGGYVVQKSINKGTEILLTNDINSTTSKITKAKKLSIKIISYDDFFNGLT